MVQGYGLTETAPAITITHPFRMRKGSVGEKLPNIEVKIAEDGEILVKGPNVSPGYYRNEEATQQTFEDGWLRTGDLGRFDDQGHLQLLGRKKEVIVTAEGLNVYPQDVESVLDQDPRVRESAIVAQERDGRSEVHAVLVLAENVDESKLPDIVASANQNLEGFQHIRSWSLWPDRSLPRTSNGKLKRAMIAAGIGSRADSTPSRGNLAADLVSGLRRDEGELRLDADLALSSLERVELMVELEQKTGVMVDETAFARVALFRMWRG